MIAINKSRRRLLKIVGVAAVGAIVGKSFVTFKDKDELLKKNEKLIEQQKIIEEKEAAKKNSSKN